MMILVSMTMFPGSRNPMVTITVPLSWLAKPEISCQYTIISLSLSYHCTRKILSWPHHTTVIPYCHRLIIELSKVYQRYITVRPHFSIVTAIPWQSRPTADGLALHDCCQYHQCMAFKSLRSIPYNHQQSPVTVVVYCTVLPPVVFKIN